MLQSQLANRMNVYCITVGLVARKRQPPKHDTKRFAGKPTRSSVHMMRDMHMEIPSGI
jgi:hypothetical protein